MNSTNAWGETTGGGGANSFLRGLNQDQSALFIGSKKCVGRFKIEKKTKKVRKGV